MPGRRLFVAPERDRPLRLRNRVDVTIVGGGVAGFAAATVLAERGARVTVREAQATVGGRTGAWPLPLSDGSTVVMEHGFHAFFRQYYNLRALLKRAGVRLVPLDDYPIISPRWPPESFTGLPRRPPWSLLALILRSPSIGWRDLVHMDGEAATPLLAFDGARTYQRFDHRTASELLDSLRFPQRARSMLFDVFSHSFFNREDDMSAAELLAMFHFYFLGNPEGLLFDVPDGDYVHALWEPWSAYLSGLGVTIATSSAVTSLDDVAADAVVVACDVPGLLGLARGTALEPMVAPLAVAPPYAVLRLWTDRDCAVDRPRFAGVSDAAMLDSISLYHRLERESEEWSRCRGGGVYELHAYAIDSKADPSDVKQAMVEDLAVLYPETRGMGVIDEHWRWAADCPGFPPGSDATRPGVVTGIPGVYLAGDFVRLPFPAALMERSAASGVMAANEILDRHDAQSEPVWSVPRRGLLAGLALRKRAPAGP